MSDNKTFEYESCDGDDPERVRDTLASDDKKPDAPTPSVTGKRLVVQRKTVKPAQFMEEDDGQ